MTHPLTPPPELVQELARSAGYKIPPGWLTYALEKVFQAGADQELETCCEWIAAYPWLDHPELLIKQLRAARRPKPPSLKEQAIAVLEDASLDAVHYNTILRALEALPDD